MKLSITKVFVHVSTDIIWPTENAKISMSALKTRVMKLPFARTLRATLSALVLTVWLVILSEVDVVSQANASPTLTALTPQFARVLSAETHASQLVPVGQTRSAGLWAIPFLVGAHLIPKATQNLHAHKSNVPIITSATRENHASMRNV